MGSRTVRLVTTIFLALVLAAGLATFAAGWSPGKAEAQTTADPAILTPEQEREMYRMREWLKHAKPSDFGTPEGSSAYTSPEEAAKRQRILAKATRKTLSPGLSTHLITKGGLAGVAAGVWIHNGLMLYNASQCGQTSCPEPLILDAEFRQAQDTAASNGGTGAIVKAYNTEGQVVGSAMVLRAELKVTSGHCDIKFDVVGCGASYFNTYIGQVGLTAANNGSTFCARGGQYITAPTTTITSSSRGATEAGPGCFWTKDHLAKSPYTSEAHVFGSCFDTRVGSV